LEQGGDEFLEKPGELLPFLWRKSVENSPDSRLPAGLVALDEGVTFRRDAKASVASVFLWSNPSEKVEAGELVDVFGGRRGAHTEKVGHFSDEMIAVHIDEL